MSPNLVRPINVVRGCMQVRSDMWCDVKPVIKLILLRGFFRDAVPQEAGICCTVRPEQRVLALARLARAFVKCISARRCLIAQHRMQSNSLHTLRNNRSCFHRTLICSGHTVPALRGKSDPQARSILRRGSRLTRAASWDVHETSRKKYNPSAVHPTVWGQDNSGDETGTGEKERAVGDILARHQLNAQ